jgi:hypothetical protein
VVDGSVAEGTRTLESRPRRADLAPDPSLPADTRLWAALQNASGGTWGGCVFDVDRIVRALGEAAPEVEPPSARPEAAPVTPGRRP